MLLISDGPAFDFGTLGPGTSTNHIFVVTNNGTATATAMGSALGAPFGFMGGSYPGVGGSCGPTLPVGASCSIDVVFTAGSSPGLVSASLAIAYFDGAAAASATRTISGTATSHAFLSITDFPVLYYQQYGLGADPTTFSFGAHGVGSSTPHTFYVTNTGATTAATMTGSGLGGAFSFAGASKTYPGAGGSCGPTLAAGAGCTVVVVFSPGGTTGSTATLTIGYNDGAGPASANRPLAGSGTSGPVLVVQDFDVTNLYPAAWTFGTRGVGQPISHTFYVLNTGGAPASAMVAPAIGTGFEYVGGSYPGSGGTCTTALAAGTSCTVNVEFKPAAPGPATGSVRIDYRDPSATLHSAARVVTGTGTTLGVLEIDEKTDHNEGLVTDFGIVGPGATAERVFTVWNVGGGPISALAFDAVDTPFSFPGGFPGKGGDCGPTLAPGISCTIVVDFTPAAAGSFQTVLAASYDDGAATQNASRTLVGTAVDGARLVITDWSDGGGGGNQSPFDFGTWGIPTDHTFYVANQGNKTATVLVGIAPGAPFAFKGTGFPGAGGSCQTTLAAGAACTVVVSYSGASTSGGTFGVSYDDGDGQTQTATRDVVGEAAVNAVLNISDCDKCGGNSNPADFGVVGTSAQRTFAVSNTGAKTAVMVRDGGLLAPPFAFTGPGYPGTNGTCSSTLDPGQSCWVSVTFTPGGPGSFAGTLGVAYDDGTGTGQMATRALTGSQTSQALLNVHDYSETDTGGNGVYDFGTVGIVVDHTFTITNDGAQPATLIMDGGGLGNGFAWKGTGYPGTFGTCGTSLAAGAHCTVVVTFTPSGSKPLTSTMLIQYYDGANSQYVKHGLAATSTTAALLQITDGDQPPQSPNGPNPPAADFGVTGTPVARTFTVTNWGGGAAAMVADGGTLGSGFGWTGSAAFGGGSCGTSLAKGASCTVSVTFTPSGDGPQSSTLSIAYNDGAAARVATRALSGTGTTKALVDIFDWDNPPPGGFSNNGPPFDFGVWGIAVDHTFTLRNDGGGPASMMMTGGSMGTGFAFKDSNYPGTTGDCGPTLAVGATCKIVVTFTPTGSVPLAGQVRVAYNDGAATRTAVRAVTATPTNRAHVTVTEYFGPGGCDNCSPFDWGPVSVGGSIQHTFTVTNTGALTATGIMPSGSLAAPFAFNGPSGYPGQGGDCMASLAPGHWCSLVLVFAPQSAGFVTGSIGVVYNDTFMSPLDAERAMQGTGN